MRRFSAIRELALRRKGGEENLNRLLTEVASNRRLKALANDRYLAQMTRCVFNAGFHWRVITQKWPGFEAAFHGFDLEKLLCQSPDQWEAYMRDERIVRNWQKIQTVFANAQMIEQIADEHGSFAHWFADWPVQNQVGLMQFFKKQGARLGGQTGQYFIRFIGKDSFVTSSDVITALIANGVEINAKPTSQRDLNRIQQAFNHWQDETGLPMTHISKILGFTVGDNINVDVLLNYQGGQDISRG